MLESVQSVVLESESEWITCDEIHFESDLSAT